MGLVSRTTSLLICCIAMAACSSNPSSGPAPAPTPTFSPTGYRVLYNFHQTSGDGVAPYAALIDVSGELYGTTSIGGSGSACTSGCGTVFRTSTSGSERVLYDFGSYPKDGRYPYYSLSDVGSSLYGTTTAGGFGSFCALSSGCGTVFRLDASGQEHIIYSFDSHAHDGVTPASNLVSVNGTLYGTTSSGGSAKFCTLPSGCGTIYSIDSAGGERIAYEFGSYAGDGFTPSGDLIAVNGTIYGTAERGGTYKRGTIFTFVPKRHREDSPHSFSGTPDGQNPRAGLVFFQGSLYGTTPSGGANGDGTVYSFTTYGAENVLYSFGAAGDGKNPEAGLVAASNLLYGTTARGGSASYGTIFSVNTSGAEKVLYSFDGTHGSYPYGALLELNDSLFGTTAFGGAGTSCRNGALSGCGTIFEYIP